jgi:hypothetical protein
VKLCPTCGVTKPPADFHWKYKSKGQRQYQCRDCMRAYIRDHYRRNTEYYVDKARRRKHQYIRETYAKIRDYFETHPCVDCGETDPVVLEFDHIDRESKEAAISEMVQAQRPWQAILNEIAKCEVRCANCHRRRTAAQAGWFSYLLGSEEGR